MNVKDVQRNTKSYHFVCLRDSESECERPEKESTQEHKIEFMTGMLCSCYLKDACFTWYY